MNTILGSIFTGLAVGLALLVVEWYKDKRSNSKAVLRDAAIHELLEETHNQITSIYENIKLTENMPEEIGDVIDGLTKVREATTKAMTEVAKIGGKPSEIADSISLMTREAQTIFQGVIVYGMIVIGQQVSLLVNFIDILLKRRIFLKILEDIYVKSSQNNMPVKYGTKELRELARNMGVVDESAVRIQFGQLYVDGYIEGENLSGTGDENISTLNNCHLTELGTKELKEEWSSVNL